MSHQQSCVWIKKSLLSYTKMYFIPHTIRKSFHMTSSFWTLSLFHADLEHASVAKRRMTRKQKKLVNQLIGITVWHLPGNPLKNTVEKILAPLQNHPLRIKGMKTADFYVSLKHPRETNISCVIKNYCCNFWREAKEVCRE